MAKPDDKKPPALDAKAAAAAATSPAPAKPEKTAEALPVKRAVAPLIASRWSEAQFVQARHSVRPEAGTAYEDLFNPAYFAHIAAKLRAGDIVEARPAEGSYYAELYVWAVGPGWAQVSELTKIQRPAGVADASANKGFAVDFVEGTSKHRIIRLSDRQVMAKGFDTPEAAREWLAANAAQIAA